MCSYRGVDCDLGSTFKKGKMVVWWSVTSVTGNIEVMETFLKSTKKTIFSIAAKNAKNVRRYSAFPKEDERIIPPGTVFVVEGILTIGPGVSMVQLKQDEDIPSLIDIGEDIYAICDPSTDPVDGGDGESYATIEPEEGNAVEGEEWYMGKIARGLAEKLVTSAAPGAFLVRESESKKGSYTLSVNGGQTYTHYRINQEGSAYFIAKRVMFTSIKELIEHYTKFDDGLCTQLTQPCPKEQVLYHGTAIEAVVTGYEHKQELYEVLTGNEITYDVEQELGHGNFGIVYKGRVKGVAVAVKVVRIKPPKAGQPPLTPSDLKQKKAKGVADMQNEIVVMEGVASFGGHPNLIKLISFDRNSVEPLLALEFCAGGTLLQLAKDSKPAAGQPHNREWFGSLDRFALEIANGMAYLEKNKFVHRDVACRSILLDGNDVCKIAHFGLARRNVDGADDEAYQMNTNQFRNPTAWKWTAPEGNEDDLYTTKSDVWSYGIMLAEMCQYGDKPYKKLGFKKWSQAFSDHVNADGTKDMIRPFWPALLKLVMTLCWELRPTDRPSFATIAKSLSTALAAGAGGGGGQGAVEPTFSGHGGDGGGGAAAARGAAVVQPAANQED